MTRDIQPARAPFAPFVRLFDVNRIGHADEDVEITAKPAECEALARLDGLLAIRSLAARFTIKREGGTGLTVRGEVRATVTQACSVTLEPVTSDIVEPVEVHYRPQAEVQALVARAAAEALNHGETSPDEDLPDPIINNRIDLGALAAEFLVLGLDPYPRRPEATLPAEVVAAEDKEAEEDASPFAALVRLRSDAPRKA
jgi:uncharacterized metal-binding protein YceD (DUF177 family)